MVSIRLLTRRLGLEPRICDIKCGLARSIALPILKLHCTTPTIRRYHCILYSNVSRRTSLKVPRKIAKKIHKYSEIPQKNSKRLSKYRGDVFQAVGNTGVISMCATDCVFFYVGWASSDMKRYFRYLFMKDRLGNCCVV